MKARYLLATFVLGLLPILALFAVTSQAAQMNAVPRLAPDLSPASMTGSRSASLETVVSATVVATQTLDEDLDAAPAPTPASIPDGATTTVTTASASVPTLVTTGIITRALEEVPEVPPPAIQSAGQPQTVCPLMGGKINKDIYADHAGKRVYFCCAGCVDAFKKDPAKYIKQMEDKGIVLANAE